MVRGDSIGGLAFTSFRESEKSGSLFYIVALPSGKAWDFGSHIRQFDSDCHSQNSGNSLRTISR